MAKVRVVLPIEKSGEIDGPNLDEVDKAETNSEVFLIDQCVDLHRVLSGPLNRRATNWQEELDLIHLYQKTEESVIAIAEASPRTRIGKEKKNTTIESYIALRADRQDPLIRLIRALCQASLSA